MKTTYLTSLTARFNPFSKAGKVPRLFLQLLPPKAHKDIKITQKVLPKTSSEPALLELGFKDGKKMVWTWNEPLSAQARKLADAKKTAEGGKVEGKVALQDIVEEVDRHARILGRKEELNG